MKWSIAHEAQAPPLRSPASGIGKVRRLLRIPQVGEYQSTSLLLCGVPIGQHSQFASWFHARSHHRLRVAELPTIPPHHAMLSPTPIIRTLASTTDSFLHGFIACGCTDSIDPRGEGRRTSELKKMASQHALCKAQSIPGSHVDFPR